MESKTLNISIGGQELIFETGKIARQANGAVFVKCGDTWVFASACASKAPLECDFLPLRIDYTEKFSAAGKTLGGFIKREGRPTQREILVSRLIDRPLRPLFEDGYTHDVQILAQVYSYDGVHNPDVLAICAASAALVISDIPLLKPIGAVRVGYIDNEFVVNPSIEQMTHSRLDLVIAGTEDAILMIEGYADFLSEEQILEAVDEGHAAIKTICQGLLDWQKTIGKEKKKETLHRLPEGLTEEIEALIKDDLVTAISLSVKQERETRLAAIDARVYETFCPETSEKSVYSKNDVAVALKKVSANYMRQMILRQNRRCDGRSTTDIRQISIDMDLLPRTHGSVLFTRGETQTIAVCTLGGESMAQRFEDLQEDGLQRFYLQYYFPPYSVGEVGRMGSPGRREIGHGKLAERALSMALPHKETFPYTIRLESNITESNGSSSMASVCGGCLAMMAAGVPVKHPIAGIAMGLILEGDQFAILSDILGIEDALGDMDFKVAGDRNGITAFQLDIKVEGITRHIMELALKQAKDGRLHILDKMIAVCPKPNESLSIYAPKIEIVKVPTSKIAIIIGPGGKQIRKIIEETKAGIDIDESGSVSITSTCSDSLRRAKEIIIDLISEVEEGKTYTGKISGIRPFGVFVKIFNQEGLLHISEISHQRLETLDGMFKEGEEITVKVLEKNKQGQIRLSRKALLTK